MPDITPNDMINQEFRRAFRGYNAQEVDEFLQLASDSLFHAYEESQRLHAQVVSLADEVKRYQQRENLINNAIVLAERTADELKEHAVREAEHTRRAIEEQLHTQRAELEQLRQTRLRVIAELRAELTAHLSLLESAEQRAGGAHGMPPKEEPQ